MTVKASLVKILRDRTKAGMMECKRALVACKGDLELAYEELRKTGIVKASKKGDRTAAEGVVVAKISTNKHAGAMIELNCETDFVAKSDQFGEFASQLTEAILTEGLTNIDTLNNVVLPMGKSIEQRRLELVTELGENIQLRRLESYQSKENYIACYLHGSKIGVIIEINTEDETVAKDIAMHIAACEPKAISPEHIAEDEVAKEKALYAEQVKAMGRPPEIAEKIILGKINKFLDEITLLGQPFVKEPKQKVRDYLKANNAKVFKFSRFEVGEGIEKTQTNFADEVKAQVEGK